MTRLSKMSGPTRRGARKRAWASISPCSSSTARTPTLSSNDSSTLRTIVGSFLLYLTARYVPRQRAPCEGSACSSRPKRLRAASRDLIVINVDEKCIHLHQPRARASRSGCVRTECAASELPHSSTSEISCEEGGQLERCAAVAPPLEIKQNLSTTRTLRTAACVSSLKWSLVSTALAFLFRTWRVYHTVVACLRRSLTSSAPSSSSSSACARQ